MTWKNLKNIPQINIENPKVVNTEPGGTMSGENRYLV